MARPAPSSTLLALLLLSGCAIATRQKPLDGPAPVTLRFAWPDGFRARVSIDHEENRFGRQPARALIRQRIVTERRGNEIWVLTRDSRAEGADSNLNLNLRVGEILVYVVSAQGAFLRAEGLEEATDLILQDGEERDREPTRLSLRQMAAGDWSVTVGTWIGRRLEEGKPVLRRIEGDLPLLPATTILDLELSFEGRVPCAEGLEPRCVQLRYASSPATKRGLLELLRTALAPEGWSLEDAEARFEARIVTDPDTLVPRSIVVQQYLRLRILPEGGEPQEIEERIRDDYRFIPEEPQTHFVSPASPEPESRFE